MICLSVSRKGSVKVDFRIIVVIVTNDPKNQTTLADKKAKTAQRVVVEAKSGFVETLKVKQVIVKSKFRYITCLEQTEQYANKDAFFSAPNSLKLYGAHLKSYN